MDWRDVFLDSLVALAKYYEGRNPLSGDLHRISEKAYRMFLLLEEDGKGLSLEHPNFQEIATLYFLVRREVLSLPQPLSNLLDEALSRALGFPPEK